MHRSKIRGAFLARRRSAALSVPLSRRVLRMAETAVDLSTGFPGHLVRFAERLIVVWIWSVPRSSLRKLALATFACPAFGTMNTNALIGLVLKNPEVRHRSPRSRGKSSLGRSRFPSQGAHLSMRPRRQTPQADPAAQEQAPHAIGLTWGVVRGCVE
jgi:hypothetical protein